EVQLQLFRCSFFWGASTRLKPKKKTSVRGSVKQIVQQRWSVTGSPTKMDASPKTPKGPMAHPIKRRRHSNGQLNVGLLRSDQECRQRRCHGRPYLTRLTHDLSPQSADSYAKGNPSTSKF